MPAEEVARRTECGGARLQECGCASKRDLREVLKCYGGLTVGTADLVSRAWCTGCSCAGLRLACAGRGSRCSPKIGLGPK